MHQLRTSSRLVAAIILAGSAVLHAAALPPWAIGPFEKIDAANPVLSPGTGRFTCPVRGREVSWEKDNVFNPAAVVRDGRVALLYRAEDDSGSGIGLHTSRIGLAWSGDAKGFRRLPRPVLYPAGDAQKAFDWPGGCEDPRVVETADGGYVLTYTAWNRLTARLSAATSRDLVHWTKHGPVFETAAGGRFANDWSKSGSIVCSLTGDHLVAAKIRGRYWMYWGEGRIHLATSSNLVDWEPVTDARGDLRNVLDTRPGKFDSNLVEPGPPAILTRDGIVLLYNGKNDGVHGDPALRPGTYSAGQALFDAADPSRLLSRTDSCFLTPSKPYETSGQYTAGTVFIEGLVRFRNRWWLYYGTADSHVAVARSAR